MEDGKEPIELVICYWLLVQWLSVIGSNTTNQFPITINQFLITNNN